MLARHSRDINGIVSPILSPGQKARERRHVGRSCDVGVAAIPRRHGAPRAVAGTSFAEIGADTARALCGRCGRDRQPSLPPRVDVTPCGRVVADHQKRQERENWPRSWRARAWSRALSTGQPTRWGGPCDPDARSSVIEVRRQARSPTRAGSLSTRPKPAGMKAYSWTGSHHARTSPRPGRPPSRGGGRAAPPSIFVRW